MSRAALSLMLYAFTLACTAWLGACAKSEVVDATEVIVVIDSDRELKSQLATIQVDVLDQDAQDVASSYEFKLEGKTKLPISFGVYQPSAGAGVFRLHTRGLGADGELLVEDKVIERFEKGKRRDLKVTLSSACRGNFCPEALTCDPRSGECKAVPRPDGKPGNEQPEGGTQIEPTLVPDAEASAPEGGAPEAGSDGGIATAPVPPSLAGAATFGGRRTDGTITVYDDGFEQGQRICTADGQFCVTGGFSP